MPIGDRIAEMCEEIEEQLAKENNISAMFPGIWLNEFAFENGTTGNEQFIIKNDNEYWTYGKHYFNLDSVVIDRSNATIKFRKVGVGKDDRKAFNSLNIIDKTTYFGVEAGKIKVKYTRLQ